jgi:hypothetical protein
MRFFLLLSADLERVVGVFRVPAGGADPEKWDPATGDWVVGPRSLLRYVFDGEIGADEVSEGRALAEASRLTA